MVFVGLLWFIGFFGMLALFAYQGYLYLKLGYWVAFSVTDVCAQHLNIQWCAWPSDWFGLYKLLSTTNAGVFLWLLLGGIFAVVAGVNATKGA